MKLYVDARITEISCDKVIKALGSIGKIVEPAHIAPDVITEPALFLIRPGNQNHLKKPGEGYKYGELTAHAAISQKNRHYRLFGYFPCFVAKGKMGFNLMDMIQLDEEQVRLKFRRRTCKVQPLTRQTASGLLQQRASSEDIISRNLLATQFFTTYTFTSDNAEYMVNEATGRKFQLMGEKHVAF